MRTLTKDQADKLRAARPLTTKAWGAVDDLSVALIDACGCDEFDPECPVCDLWSKSDKACKAAMMIGRDIDAVLLAGPEPKE